jgi:simple sugar transport system permease protein
MGWLEGRHIFLISDTAGLVHGLTSDVSLLTLLAVALVPITWFVFWRTRLGLRMRTVGENPVAAESLGVAVYRMKYIGVIVSGALAGMGGAFLVIEAAGIYREGQTGGRGFIGLAAMIFGNWRPLGAAAGSGLFGYATALNLRSDPAVHALLLFAAIAVGVVALWALYRRKLTQTGVLIVLAGLVFWWWSSSQSVSGDFVYMTPYVTTLIVLAFASQRLRPPAADGRPYRKGQEQ